MRGAALVHYVTCTVRTVCVPPAWLIQLAVMLGYLYELVPGNLTGERLPVVALRHHAPGVQEALPPSGHPGGQHQDHQGRDALR